MNAMASLGHVQTAIMAALSEHEMTDSEIALVVRGSVKGAMVRLVSEGLVKSGSKPGTWRIADKR